MDDVGNTAAIVTKVILHTPIGDMRALQDLVETWIVRKVSLVAVHGEGCEAVHDLVDQLIVGDGGNEDRFIITTWHENEPIEDVVEFVGAFGDEGNIEHVRF
jgi:hypothetical protein